MTQTRPLTYRPYSTAGLLRHYGDHTLDRVPFTFREDEPGPGRSVGRCAEVNGGATPDQGRTGTARSQRSVYWPLRGRRTLIHGVSPVSTSWVPPGKTTFHYRRSVEVGDGGTSTSFRPIPSRDSPVTVTLGPSSLGVGFPSGTTVHRGRPSSLGTSRGCTRSSSSSTLDLCRVEGEAVSHGSTGPVHPVTV